jgi:hypothetical protein
MELNNMKKIIVSEQGEQYIDLTPEEIAQRQIDEQKAEQDRITFETEKQAKIDAKASALAKLSALGLTEEEVQAIIK